MSTTDTVVEQRSAKVKGKRVMGPAVTPWGAEETSEARVAECRQCHVVTFVSEYRSMTVCEACAECLRDEQAAYLLRCAYGEPCDAVDAETAGRVTAAYVEQGLIRDADETVRWADLPDALERNGFGADVWEIAHHLGLRAEYRVADLLMHLGF